MTPEIPVLTDVVEEPRNEFHAGLLQRINSDDSPGQFLAQRPKGRDLDKAIEWWG